MKMIEGEHESCLCWNKLQKYCQNWSSKHKLRRTVVIAENADDSRASDNCDDVLRLSGMGYETNKTCALKSIEQNTVNIPDIMIEMDTLTYLMQNNLQEFIFASLKWSAFGAHKSSWDSCGIFKKHFKDVHRPKSN